MKRVIEELKRRRSNLEKRIDTCNTMLISLKYDVQAKKNHILEADLEIKEIDIALEKLSK